MESNEFNTQQEYSIEPHDDETTFVDDAPESNFFMAETVEPNETTSIQADVAPESALIDALRGLYGADAESIAAELINAASKETETKFGVPYESSEVIAKARVRGGGAVGHMTPGEERIFVRGLLRQESRIRESDPSFDLETALRRQPTLRLLLASGEPLEKALAYLNMDQRLAEKEREVESRVLSQIRARNTRPQSINRAGTGTARMDISRMSDDEIMEIDDRLRRGEKVYL